MFGLIFNMSGKCGGLNGPTQHLLEVCLQKFPKPKSCARVDSNGTLPCLALSEYSWTVRFSRGGIVIAPVQMVSHRPVELAGFRR